MVYFPERHLLYASDTLALNDDGSLYDPELMYEVAQAVKRENLIVDTVYAMHQGPMPWNQVLTLIDKSLQPLAAAPHGGPSIALGADSSGFDRFEVPRS